MNVLIVGQGGREHAIAWKIRQSPHAGRVFVAPGNDGMAQVAECVAIAVNDHASLARFARENDVNLVIIGPEAPLVAGVGDRLRQAGLRVFAPSQAAAQIEGSKSYAKTLMRKYDIPTAEARSFSDYHEAKRHIAEKGAPLVIKADGLAAGKGVTVAMSEEEAQTALAEIMVQKKHGAAGEKVIIEEFLQGEEFSLMALVHEERVIPLVMSQDHKRAFDGDRGPNTGGMGAYSPVPQLGEAVVTEALEKIVHPTVRALAAEGRPFTGVLYAGLIATESGVQVIEFNARFGDPETQVVLPRLESDLLEAIVQLLDGEDVKLKWSKNTCLGVVVAAPGYPEAPEKGFSISGFSELDPETLVFHAGTKKDGDVWRAAGGRLFLLASCQPDLKTAHARVYRELDEMALSCAFYRRDIGRRAL